MSNQDEIAQDMNSEHQTIGSRLRAAREAAGKSLADISASTRVPSRLLDALERDAVDELPRGPYAIGFARTFARAVGLDESEVADAVRAQQQHSSAGVVAALDVYEPADSSRVPPSRLAWLAAGIAVLLVIGYLVWRSIAMTPDLPADEGGQSPVAATAGTPTAQLGQPATPAPTPFADSETVRIAASGPAWFSLETAEGRTQFDLTLNAGEFYTVKPEQRGLFLRTGRPQSLRIMVGERSLPQLGPTDQIVSKVALDGASLARLAAAPPSLSAEGPAEAPPLAPAVPPIRDTEPTEGR
jgi:cytoskeletal protein RodZ